MSVVYLMWGIMKMAFAFVGSLCGGGPRASYLLECARKGSSLPLLAGQFHCLGEGERFVYTRTKNRRLSRRVRSYL